MLGLFAIMAGWARAASVTAIHRRRRGFEPKRPRGTLNNDVKNISLMWHLTRFLLEPRPQSNAVAFLLIEPARQ